MTFRKQKKGFTLIEVLVTVVLFSLIFLVAMAFVKIASGQAKSLHTKKITAEIRNAMDKISQNLNTGAAKLTIGGTTVYGFNIKNDVLGIANSASPVKCSFFGVYNGKIMMREDDVCTTWFTPSQLDNNLTSSSIKITTPANAIFDVHPMTAINPTTAPYVKITIGAKDGDPKYEADNTIDVTTIYTMDYLTVKNFK